MAFISTNLPDAIRRHLHAGPSACMQQIAQLQEINNHDYESGTAKFIAIHCS